MSLTLGQTVNNRYRIVELLGQGGFGAVYRAWDANLDEPVALKESYETSPVAQKQFQLEAKLLFRLHHANLPRVHDFFVIPGQGMYLVMDYIEGEDLGEKLARIGGPLPEAQVLEWASQVCDAMEYLHSQNPPVIHRDIKPANIKITPQGKAMLVDFGIAKVYDPNLITTFGARAVTPGYSPQEQYGMGATDARSDVYALGATFYHLLTGQAPPESIQRNIDDTLALPSSLNPAISNSLERAILQALEPHPSQRFQSIAAFKAALISTSQAQYNAGRSGLVMPGPIKVAAQVNALDAGTQVVASPRHIPWRIGLGILVLIVIVAGIIMGGQTLLGSVSDRKATQSVAARAIVPGNTAQIDDTNTPYPTSQPLATTKPPPLPTLTATITLFSTSTETALPTILPANTDVPVSTSFSQATLVPMDLPAMISDTHGVSMALVPAGSFLMGDDEKVSGSASAQPAHEVTLAAFYIDIFEVTNSRYAECVEAGKCDSPGCAYFGKSEYNDYPVVCIDWLKALAYCQWRDTRLPTEAEWEKAARGGLEGMSYPWGNSANCQLANYWNRSSLCKGHPIEVGNYPPNGYGLYDMAGNVWEWTSSLLWAYPYQADDGREDLTAAGERAMRGGSYYSYAIYCAYRYDGVDPNDNIDSHGFRCARSPQ